MPDVWHEWENPDEGTRIQARKYDAPFSVTYASDGIERRGETGDYLVKGHDGLLRIIPEADFEARFRRLEIPEEAPRTEPVAEGKHQALQAKALQAGPKLSAATVEGR